MSFSPIILTLSGVNLALHSAPGLEGDLTGDLQTLKQQGVSAMITTLTDEELQRFGIAGLGPEAESQGIAWQHLPVKDKSLPDEAFEHHWPQAMEQLLPRLLGGERVSVHCRGGTGRTGLVAARLLLAAGIPLSEVVEAVRQARPGALASEEQVEYLSRHQA